MNVARTLIEGLKMVSLFGAVAPVVWSMPETEPLHAHEAHDHPAVVAANTVKP